MTSTGRRTHAEIGFPAGTKQPIPRPRAVAPPQLRQVIESIALAGSPPPETVVGRTVPRPTEVRPIDAASSGSGAAARAVAVVRATGAAGAGRSAQPTSAPSEASRRAPASVRRTSAGRSPVVAL